MLRSRNFGVVILVCLGVCASAYWARVSSSRSPDRAWTALLEAGNKLYDDGRYAEAKEKYLAALEIAERCWPQAHCVATSKHQLARACQGLAEYDQAETLHQSALAIYERALGPD